MVLFMHSMWRNADLMKGTEGTLRRALYRAVGLGDSEFDRPIIGVANTWNELSPGHFHLRQVSEAVKAGVWQAGGTPLEFGCISTCGGIALGPGGADALNYELPLRDCLAFSIEIVAEVHRLDGLVLLSSCDNVIPGELLAAARLNLPSIVVTGGPMLPGNYNGKEILMPDLDTATLGTFAAGKLSEQELFAMERAACPTCGACPVLGTANSMQIISEALGMTLPGSSTIPAVYAERLRSARESGRKIVELIRRDLKPSEILARGAFENAVRVDLAIGGSTNVPLHLLALARTIGLEMSLDKFDELSRLTPCICRVQPNGPYNVIDLHNAGGTLAIMLHLKDQLDLDVLTVSGRTLRENLDLAICKNSDVIRPLSNPVFKEGGLAILKGTLAPNGAIVRQSAVAENMLRVKGPAVVFDTDEDSYRAIRGGKIQAGDIIIIRYEGPRGAPGMREVMLSCESIVGMGMETQVSLVTDGRFSGFSRGPIIGHVSPEAALGGPLAVVENGDTVLIDIPKRKLDVDLSEGEIGERLAKWSPPKAKVRPGFLSIYAAMVESAELGASMRVPRT